LAFQSLNLAFISLTESVDTSTPYGQAGVHHPWRRGGTGAQPDRGTNQKWHEEEGREEAWPEDWS
jgi:hypothetical protein